MRTRRSDSVKACSRSRFWSDTTPVASPATMSGAQAVDFAASPWIAPGCPYSMARSEARSLISSGSRVSMTCLRMPISGIGSSGNRTPRSIVYGKWIRPSSRS